MISYMHEIKTPRHWFCFWRNSPTRARAALFLRFLDHTQWRATDDRFLCTRNRPVANTSTWQHTTLTRDKTSSGGIQTGNANKQATADLRLRPHGYWERDRNTKVYYTRKHLDATGAVMGSIISLYTTLQVHLELYWKCEKKQYEYLLI